MKLLGTALVALVAVGGSAFALASQSAPVDPSAWNGFFVDEQWHEKGRVRVAFPLAPGGEREAHFVNGSLTFVMNDSEDGYTTTPGAVQSWDVWRLGGWPGSPTDSFILDRKDGSSVVVNFAKTARALRVLDHVYEEIDYPEVSTVDLAGERSITLPVPRMRETPSPP